MKVLALTGMPGSGKSEIASYAKVMSVPVIRMGDMVIAEVEERGLEPNSKNVGVIADEMRKTHGKDIWARRTIEYIEKYILPSNPDIIIIDGVRGLEEIDAFRERFGDDLAILAVHASPKTRHRRILSRMRADDGRTMMDVVARDLRELSWGIGKVIAMADYMIVNEGTIVELQNSFMDIIKKIRSEGAE